MSMLHTLLPPLNRLLPCCLLSTTDSGGRPSMPICRLGMSWMCCANNTEFRQFMPLTDVSYSAPSSCIWRLLIRHSDWLYWRGGPNCTFLRQFTHLLPIPLHFTKPDDNVWSMLDTRGISSFSCSTKVRSTYFKCHLPVSHRSAIGVGILKSAKLFLIQKPFTCLSSRLYSTRLCSATPIAYKLHEKKI